MFFYKDTAEAASTASFHISNNPAAPSVQPEEGKISRCDPDLPGSALHDGKQFGIEV